MVRMRLSALVMAIALVTVGSILSVEPARASAPGEWSHELTPNTADGQTTNLLQDVACTSASDCWAAGYYDSGNTRYQTLIQRWDGVAWSRVPSPNTSPAQNNQLQSVACTSASDCWAVGTSGTSRTLAVHWDGTTWSIATSPNSSATQSNWLTGVTCASTSECWAVGYYLNGGTYQTLIMRWDGNAWGIVASPNVSPTQHHRLLNVTCASTSACWAVGYYTAGVDQRLIERWDGNAWSLDTSPNTNSTDGNRLHGVTCVSTADCWAVGNYNGYSNARTLVERWNGTVWSAVASPSPSATQNNFLTAVTCASASDCTAVGNNYSGSSSRTIIARWDGVAWTLASSPNSSPTQQNFLTSVACVSGVDCWAFGNYYIGSAIYQSLIERWDGTSWSIVSAYNAGAPKDNQLASVTCVTPSDCWAVGYGIVNAVGQTLIQRWDGVAWSIMPSPNPAADKGGSLSAVTCVSASDCWAVGSGAGSNFYGQTLTEHWDGSSWSVVPSPSTSATQGNNLLGVSCVSSSDCWAVGTYAAGSADQTLTLHWDGTTWALVASANISPTQGNYLNAVSCASATQCWAVGYARDFSAPPLVKSYTMIVERWDGSSWTLDPSSTTSVTRNQLLRGVTCVAVSECWIVGFDWDVGEAYYHTLARRWDGTAWTTITTPNTSPTQYNLLSAVSCAAASDCWAVGNASAGSAYQTLAMRWDGASWAIVASPNTSATQTNVLSSVSCASSATCAAVGNFHNGTASRTLAARYAVTPPPNLPGAPAIGTPAAGAILTASSVTIAGTASPGVTVRIFEGDTLLETTGTDGAGSWSVMHAFPDGPHTIAATATDEVGTSPASMERGFTVDTSIPGPPLITSPASGAALNASSVTIAGTAEAGSTVRVSEGASLLETVVAEPSGAFSVTHVFADGPHTVTATATDAAGTSSAPSAARTFTVDTLAPDAPTIATPAEGATLTDSFIALSGTSEPAASVTLREGAWIVATVQADNSGAWSTAIGFTNNAHAITATTTDTAGNTGTSPARAFTVTDTTAPAAPVINTPAQSSSVDASLVVATGSAEAGANITLHQNGEIVGATTTNTAGAWRARLFGNPTGTQTITASATDPAGNASAKSTPRSFTVTVTAAPGLVITSPGQNSIQPGTMTFTGTGARPGHALALNENGSRLATVMPAADGTWTMNLSLPTGAHTVVATSTGIDASQPVTFTVDADPPAVQVTTTPRTVFLPGDVVRIAGRADDNLRVVAVTVTYFDAFNSQVAKQSATCTCTPGPQTVSWTANPTLPSGSYTAVVQAVDQVGNISPTRTTTFIVI